MVIPTTGIVWESASEKLLSLKIYKKINYIYRNKRFLLVPRFLCILIIQFRCKLEKLGLNVKYRGNYPVCLGNNCKFKSIDTN